MIVASGQPKIEQRFLNCDRPRVRIPIEPHFMRIYEFLFVFFFFGILLAEFRSEVISLTSCAEPDLLRTAEAFNCNNCSKASAM